jgi:hypothetical protein
VIDDVSTLEAVNGMICPEPQTKLDLRPVGGRKTVSDAIESFVNAARDVLGIFVSRMPCADIHHASSAEFSAKLKRCVSRAAAAAKAIELPKAAPNPKRVESWLETSAPHISPVCSPLKERGPPHP